MMKQKITLLLVGLFILSCGAGPEKGTLEEKKAELEKYKKELAEIQKKIKDLEEWIAANDTSVDSQKKAKVAIAEVKPKQFMHFIELQGMIDSEDNAFVGPAIPGLVTSINVKEGDLVGRGRVMATTESSNLQSALVEIQTSLDLATIAYEKQKRLWDQNIGSEIQYLQAKSNMESLQARKKSIQSQIAMTRIVAPFRGTVDAIKVQVGEMANPGMSGIRVVNLDKMKATANVSDTYISNVKKGAPVIVEVPDLGISMDAKITFVSKSVNSTTRSFTVDVKLSNKDKMLRPNLVAKVLINDETIEDAIVVPSKVIQSSINGEHYVMLAEKKDGLFIAKKVIVETGSDYRGETVILSGIKEGDIVVTEGYVDLIEGQFINGN